MISNPKALGKIEITNSVVRSWACWTIEEYRNDAERLAEAALILPDLLELQ